jgi:hypothetical protein
MCEAGKYGLLSFRCLKLGGYCSGKMKEPSEKKKIIIFKRKIYCINVQQILSNPVI